MLDISIEKLEQGILRDLSGDVLNKVEHLSKLLNDIFIKVEYLANQSIKVDCKIDYKQVIKIKKIEGHIERILNKIYLKSTIKE